MSRSFGKYFDDQRDRLRKAIQRNKNAQLNCEWRERYDDREREKQEKEEKRFKKELEECSDKGVEISQECKTFYKKKYEWWKRTP